MTTGLSDMVQLARQIAQDAHKNQYRRDGVTPYFRHVERVANMVGGSHAKIIAYLHDVIEDGDESYKSLVDKGIDELLAMDVVILTKLSTQTYQEYLARIAVNSVLARHVKIADILDNLGDNPTDKQRLKYVGALKYLLGYNV